MWTACMLNSFLIHITTFATLTVYKFCSSLFSDNMTANLEQSLTILEKKYNTINSMKAISKENQVLVREWDLMALIGLEA
jgi:hypothetical protein